MEQYQVQVNPGKVTTMFYGSNITPDNTDYAGLLKAYKHRQVPEIRNHIIYWSNDEQYSQRVETAVSSILADGNSQLTNLLDNISTSTTKQGKVKGFMLTMENYGILAYVYAGRLVRGNFAEENIPSFYAIASRPGTSLLNETSAELNLRDRHGLAMVENSLSEFKNQAFANTDIFAPTVKNLGFYADGDLTVMVNEKAGWRGPDKTPFSAAEVNIQIYEIDGVRYPVFELNNSTAEFGLEYDPFAREFSNIFNFVIQPEPAKVDEHLQTGLDQSSRLAAGYVAALTQVWLLTGRIPNSFSPNAGDGVVLNTPGLNSTREIQLITLRGGLQGNALSFQQFRDWLKTRMYPSLNYSMLTGQNTKHIPSGEDYLRAFNEEVIARGTTTAFYRMFAQEYSQKAAMLTHENPDMSFENLRSLFLAEL